jgi:glycosyltransferase involved in cell wall biosynthesis
MAKILHVITSTQVGGAEKHLLALAKGLHKDGWDCTVAYLKGRPDLNVDYLAAGIPVHPLDLKPWLDAGTLGRLMRLIRQERPDIVHAHLFPAEVYATAAHALARSGAQLVCTKHNDDDFLVRPHFRFLHCLISRRAARIITISEHVRRYTLRIGTLYPSRLVTIPYGHDGSSARSMPNGFRQELGVGDDTFLVGTVGRLAPQKGQRHLIEAMRSVVAAGQNAGLAIVGEGPLRERLEQQVAAAGLIGRVFFAGFRPDAPDLMRAFDVFVLPSLWEGFGLVLLEAMAAARPIVASRVSAIPEVVEDGVSGLLVPPGDARALAEAVLTLRNDATRRARLGTAGAERLRREFTLERVVERTTEVYRAVLGKKDSGSSKT